jgi:N utilization substance protein B
MSGGKNGSPARAGPFAGGRRAARLCAVQALFQAEFARSSADAVVAEFESHRLAGELGGEPLAPEDRSWFAGVVRGTIEDGALIDERLARRLAPGWTLPQLDGVVRAVLRAGAYELLRRLEVPARVVISEYVGVAQGFCGARELGFVNATLDSLARELRADEFAVASGDGRANAR